MTNHRCPLSRRQTDIWIEWTLAPNQPAQNIGCYREISGKFDRDLLTQAIYHVVSNSDALRLVLRDTERGVEQEILPTVVPPLQFFDAQDKSQAVALAKREIQHVFPMFDALLYRFALTTCSAEYSILNLTFHHLIVDGWAISVVYERIFVAYNALLAEVPLDDDYPMSLDFVAVDDHYKTSTSYLKDETFWHSHSYDNPPDLMQRRQVAQSAVYDTTADILDVYFPRAGFEALVAESAPGGATPFQFCLAVIFGFFARLRGVDDFVLGISLLNRPTARAKQTIGMCASNGIVRVRRAIHKTVSQIATGIAAESRTVYKHHRYPITDLLRKKGAAALERERVCDVTISYLVTPPKIGDIGGAKLGPLVQVLSGHQHSPVQVFVANRYASTDDVRFAIACRREYFGEEDLAELGVRMRSFFEHLIEFPHKPLSHIPMLLDHERRLIDAQRIADKVPPGGFRFLHEILSAQAAVIPEAVAIQCGNQSITYAEFEKRANRLAHQLIRRGAGAETVVALGAGRSAELVIGMLGILKAGCAFLMIDPNGPPARVAFMTAAAHALFLVSESSAAESLRYLGLPQINLDGEASSVPDCPDSAPKVHVHPENLAYVVFTSGSTGEPKGAMIPHRGLHSFAEALIPRFGLDSTSRILQFARSSFDAATSEVILALVAGATLCIARAEELLPGSALAHTLNAYAVTYVALPPSALPSLQDFDFPALRTLEVAGESCPVALAKLWSTRCERFINAYGPSEATICATVAEYHHGSCVPIGSALENVSVYVLDDLLSPVPLGVVGELYIGGLGVGRGYLNSAALTAERFVANPFGDANRLYRSGDCVRYLPSGELEFVGRRDHCVKIRGFRVELGEVEAALLSHAMVCAAVVEVDADVNGSKRLVAFVTLNPGSNANPSNADAASGMTEHSAEKPLQQELRSHMRRLLPDYMIPTVFVVLKDLPLTNHGKIDRAALPAISPILPKALGDSLEARLVSIFSQTLSVPELSVDENFFEVGGNSLHLSLVVVAINKQLGLNLPLIDIFRYPNITALAEHIRAISSDSCAPPVKHIKTASHETTPPIRGNRRRSKRPAPL